MAGADYTWCAGCGAKAFYDADVSYDGVGDMAALCDECSKSFEIVVRRKKSKREIKRLDHF